MHFEDSGTNGFELPGAAPSADTAFKDEAYDMTIAATQTFNNGEYGAGTSRNREQDRGVQSGPRGRATAHQPPHQVRGAGLRIVRVDGPHSAEAGQRVGAVGFGTRHKLSRGDPILELGFPLVLRLGAALWVSTFPYLNCGWPSFGR